MSGCPRLRDDKGHQHQLLLLLQVATGLCISLVASASPSDLSPNAPSPEEHIRRYLRLRPLGIAVKELSDVQIRKVGN